ncbi:MAG TPA: serine/threonine-protein kinase [Ktedonobacteraceae bacterium]|nr:serine/threonine-protein kinase [Ktedonobacteraceae bacterium]
MEKQNKYIGKTLGSYRLTDELGSNTCSMLFLATSSSSSEQSVVVKLWHTVSIHTQQDEDTFLQEARLLQQLRHPNILPVLDAGVEQSIPYIVIAYAPNHSLHSHLHTPSTTPLARTEALAVIAQIGQALLYAHHHNVTHGNLNPHNILFNSKGHAVLADFALPSLQAILNNSPETLSYTAPEQRNGPASKESDQYALGCIIYEMFTGKAPFSHRESDTGHRPRTTLAQLKARLPQDLSLIILKAIAREPAQRYSDVQALLNALGVFTEVEADGNNQKSGASSIDDSLSTPDSDSSISPGTFPPSPLPIEEPLAHDAPTEVLASVIQPVNQNSGKAQSVARKHRQAGWGKAHQIRQPQSIKEWPLIAIAIVIIMLSILGTLTFGALSINPFQANSTLPSTSITRALTPVQSKLITPTVIVTSTPVPPPMGQRVKANPTPTPTPKPTSPPTVPPITSGSVSISPGRFSPANCAAVNGNFQCTATLSLSTATRNTLIWYATSRNSGATFNPGSGFLVPGQSVQITIDIPQNCPGTSTITFVTSRKTFAVGWSC